MKGGCEEAETTLRGDCEGTERKMRGGCEEAERTLRGDCEGTERKMKGGCEEALLIGYESGQLVLWDFKACCADVRYQATEPLRSVSWHHEGKQFMCCHTDGSLTTWTLKQASARPTSTVFPHGKI
ncbi:hypothetical protein O3P69_006291 [Scylla paramamosain]|uniref:Uncharacterized protein n=1 Tax=Scylla paramamosain TaxID=85552 RepID=A0AAW0U3B1_SCYPA